VQAQSSLEGLAALCASPQTLVDVFINYDCNLQVRAHGGGGEGGWTGRRAWMCVGGFTGMLGMGLEGFIETGTPTPFLGPLPMLPAQLDTPPPPLCLLGVLQAGNLFERVMKALSRTLCAPEALTLLPPPVTQKMQATALQVWFPCMQASAHTSCP
jgi:hypothetical protein